MATATPSSKPADAASMEAGSRLLHDLIELSTYYSQRGLKGEELTPAELHYIIALVRYQFTPAATSALSRYVQVMVFGGAGAGKSTTVNIIVGAVVADANAQAGYTRYPILFYRPSSENVIWPDQLGPLRRIDRPEAANLDQDLFRVQTVPDNVVDPGFLDTHAIWDCPDLTSKDATYYERRVIEIAALADLCIYVTSDERYNDALPTHFLQALVESGKPVLAVLTKVSSFDADELISLFRDQVLAALKNRELVYDVYAVPTPVNARAADLWQNTFPHGRQLRSSIEQRTRDVDALRTTTRADAADYLASRQGMLLDPLARDVGEWRLWVEQVRQAANHAIERYEREYLQRSTWSEHQGGSQAILAALTLTGRFAVVWSILEYARVPYRVVKSWAGRYTDKTLTSAVDESFVLDRVREQFFDSLVVTVAQKRGRHGFWDALHQAMSTLSTSRIEGRIREIRESQLRDLRTKQRSLFERMDDLLAKNQTLVLSLRGVRVGLDAVACGLGAWIGYSVVGWSVWILLFVVMALGATDDLVRYLCQEYVRRERDEISQRQRDNIRELFRSGYLDELVCLPRGLGDRLAQLSELTDRIPRAIAELGDTSKTVLAQAREDRP